MNNEPYDYAAAMDQYLSPQKIKKKAGDNAVEEALSSLNKAAEILDAMGSFGAAEVITKLMEHIPTVVNTVEFDLDVEFSRELDLAHKTASTEDVAELEQSFADELKGLF